MVARFTRGLALSITAAGLAIGLTIVPADAASQHQWQLSKVFGAANGSTDLAAVTSTGTHEAWAVGGTCPEVCTTSELLLEHWDGSDWARVPGPPALSRAGTSAVGDAIGATSAHDVWIFASTLRNVTPGTDALYWNGHHWTVYTLARAPAITQAAVFSSRNVWAFGLTATSKSTRIYAVHWNGRTWRAVTMPGEAMTVAALSARDIWAVGESAATFGRTTGTVTYIAMHWNGRRWQTISLPTLGIKSPLFLQATAATATGANSLWVQFVQSELATPPPGQPASERGTSGPATSGQPPFSGLLYWNGHRWQLVTTPYTLPASAMAPDGHGGLWLFENAGGPGNATWLYHYSDGIWTRQSLPRRGYSSGQISTFALVPGTDDLWAAGWVHSAVAAGGTSGAIFRYVG